MTGTFSVAGGPEHIDVDGHTVAQGDGDVLVEHDVGRQRPESGVDLEAR